MIPTPGRIVHYTLSSHDVSSIFYHRAFTTHVGNEPREGDVLPMLLVRPWGDTEGSAVSGQVFLDGNDTLWVTSSEGEGPGFWFVPPRV